MKAQNKITKGILTTGTVHNIFCFRPGHVCLLVDGRQQWFADHEVKLVFFCTCEQEKITEHACPFDNNDRCNCCAYCEEHCIKEQVDKPH